MAGGGNEVARKRGTVKSKLTALKNTLSSEIVDPLNVTIRLERLTETFKEYESLVEELLIEDENHTESVQYQTIENDYYATAAKVRGLTSSNSSNTTRSVNFTVPMGSSTLIERQQLVKLPIANLPQFDGQHDQWLSFKNTFLSMIDSRTDVDDLNKFFIFERLLERPSL
uniref:Uncharacterized protein n=1 Tax=Trichogramma kaykai TaxID=54128 RepID=A0ABD2WI62_9HYME